MPLSSSPSTHCWRVGEEEVCWWIPYTGWTPCAMLLSYIVFLHQTTTIRSISHKHPQLSYIVFLHQTTTLYLYPHTSVTLSYIVFLHQTTTGHLLFPLLQYCLISSFYIKPQHRPFASGKWPYCLISSFYIKPQLIKFAREIYWIVLYRLSTSNHNQCRVQA